MRRRWLLMLSIVVLAGLLGTGLRVATRARAEDEQTPTAEETVATPAVTNPVVAVIPYQSETEYEPDPFEPGQLRRARTEVKRLLLVRADGTIEEKRSW